MNANRVFLNVVSLILLLGSISMASTMMKSPTADLEQGKFNAGLEYTYSETAIDLGNATSGGTPIADSRLKNVRSNRVNGRVGYGITDNLQFDLLFGGNKTKYSEGTEKYSGDLGWDLGFATKMNFYEYENITLGGLFQFNWYQSEGDITDPSFSGDGDFNVMHVRLAAGPSFDAGNGFSFYGGPYWQCISGTKKYSQPDGYTEDYDLDALSYFGGYIGMNWLITQNINFGAELQLTSDDYLLGFMLAFGLN